MENGILTKYSASAGSGKTTRLTREYLSKLFRSKGSYRKILAVTFTNKAAAEMKGRILGNLFLISEGKLPDETDRLASVTGKSTSEIMSEAKIILGSILHDYSRFSVGTIDSFFQKVMKAFAKESGLQSGYSIELDHSEILSAAVDNLMAGLENDSTLLGWITEFALTRVEEGKTWRLKDEIISLAEELFREEYKLLLPEEKKKLRDRTLLAEYVSDLKALRSDFNGHLIKEGIKIRQILDKHGVTDDMFFHGKSGVPSFLRKIASEKIESGEPLNSYVNKVLETPPRWSTKAEMAPQLAAALGEGLDELIIGLVRYYGENFIDANTADVILSNVYTLGILSDILDQVHAITTEENKFLLSDAAELLYLIIGNDQTPFIYEKIGNSFENYMIDEFQDTSAIQWKNFKPLIDNSMGEGFNNLIVGDVKQSIYRWRNSNWRIFNTEVHNSLGRERVETVSLDTNYRSRKNIVAFNNTAFSIIPGLIDNQNADDRENYKLSGLYGDAQQKAGGRKEGGYVEFEFIEESENQKFKQIVLDKLPGIIENLQDKGYKGSDIGILVRWNNEGSEILKYLLDYRASAGEEKRKKYNYEIVSNESLILDQNPVVSFIISLLTWLCDPADDISKSLVFMNWHLATGKESPFPCSENDPSAIFPEGFSKLTDEIKHLSLFESVEKIISFFSLGSYNGNPAYLSSFQECVLEFAAAYSSGIPLFLEWWKTTGTKRSVAFSEHQDSIRVMTIHKAKGLQFRVVIIPFLTWQLSHEKNPTIWIKPETAPFNKIGLIPVKYRKSLIYSHFADAYSEERFASMVDNLNLVYVAFTRAVDCMIGFCPDKPGRISSTVSSFLRETMQCESTEETDKPVLDLPQYFDRNKSLFICGEIPLRAEETTANTDVEVSLKGYEVNNIMDKLKLKFHGEDFLIAMAPEKAAKLNYGRLMHEVFSLITNADDLENAVSKLILEGKIPIDQRNELIRRISEYISSAGIKEWFETGAVTIVETDILLPTGSIKRPDRVILKDNKTIIIDFKFGVEKTGYINQVRNYSKLMNEMGYKNVEAYLWYVDINKVIPV